MCLFAKQILGTKILMSLLEWISFCLEIFLLATLMIELCFLLDIHQRQQLIMLNSSKPKMLLALDTVMERKSGSKIKNDFTPPHRRGNFYSVCKPLYNLTIILWGYIRV